MTKSKQKGVGKTIAKAVKAAVKVATKIPKTVRTILKGGKGARNGMQNVGAARMTGVIAPIQRKLFFASTRSRKTHVVDGVTRCASAATSPAAATMQTTNASGVACAVGMNTFNIDPVASGFVSNNFVSFLSTVRNIATQYLQYRFKKLNLIYSPIASTGTDGAISIAAFPEIQSVDTVFSQLGIQACGHLITTPVWQEASIDLLQAFRNGWLFTDTLAAADAASERQECAGSVAYYIEGAPASKLCGVFYLDFEIEFKDLGAENQFLFHSTPVALEERKESDKDSVYVPQIKMDLNDPVYLEYKKRIQAEDDAHRATAYQRPVLDRKSVV